MEDFMGSIFFKRKGSSWKTHHGDCCVVNEENCCRFEIQWKEHGIHMGPTWL